MVKSIWWGVVTEFGLEANSNVMYRKWKIKKPKTFKARVRRANSRSMKQAGLTAQLGKDRWASTSEVTTDWVLRIRNKSCRYMGPGAVYRLFGEWEL